ncbi:MAG TPA: cytochrome b/b6 domain-containing protein [Gammaproteobacteria bacterium]|nr:cytochrome b/b6 domain-containing protein [Gammaproteobacteria bacterium]
MRLKDTSNGYGWLSIFLHWYTAIAVIALLFIGDTIGTRIGAQRDATLHLHTSIAITSYVFLWARIVLRFKAGHPGPLPKQRGFFFLLGKYVHFALITAIGVMLITGPLMVWASGEPIHVWDWFVIPGPLPQSFALHDMLHSIHAWSAATILVLTVLHIGGVYKHAAFNQDGTFGKMLAPPPNESPAPPPSPPQAATES